MSTFIDLALVPFLVALAVGLLAAFGAQALENAMVRRWSAKETPQVADNTAAEQVTA